MSEFEHQQLTVVGARDVATASQMKGHVQQIQQVMNAVMIVNTHYGKIPGAGDKPTLFKPGAEVLCLSFHIAPSYQVVDLSVQDHRGGLLVCRYRVTCQGVHQGSGTVLGEGVGECSSNEMKYKWRRAVNRKEWEATPEENRRIKYGSYKGKDEETMQVLTEAADVANTILKMGCKRALVAMVLNCTAASDCFAQDLEDLPEGLVEEERQPPVKPRTVEPQAKADANNNVTPKQLHWIIENLAKAGIPETEFLADFEIGSLEQLPFVKAQHAQTWIRAWKPPAETVIDEGGEDVRMNRAEVQT